MNGIDLHDECSRVYKELEQFDELFITHNLITYNDVLKAHYLIAEYFINDGERVTYGVKDVNSLGSALGRQCTEFSGQKKWHNDDETCATLFYGLIKNHPFHDANKRTALLILLYQLDKQKRVLTVKSTDIDKLAVNVAKNDYSSYKSFVRFKKIDNAEIHFLADYIRKSTRKIDKKIHPITYNELNTQLKHYGFYVEDAGKGYANIMREVKVKKLLGRDKTELQKVLQIGFPGWKRQVNEKALKEVLKATKLTSDNGVDSRTFYESGESLLALIDKYREPFLRLKDK